MRWYLDTEFDENGSTIKLISIALVPEDPANEQDFYYRCLLDGWCIPDCDPWVQQNVVSKLPPFPKQWDIGPARDILYQPVEYGPWASRMTVAQDIRTMLLSQGSPPEIWAYFADYDWVAFCQLFGKMVDLPKGMPFFCRDLKQEMSRLGVRKEDLPKQEGAEHNALEDAKWCRTAHLWLIKHELGG